MTAKFLTRKNLATLSAFFALLFALSVYSITAGCFVKLDEWTAELARGSRNPALAFVFLAVTYLGSVNFIAITAVFLGIFALAYGEKEDFILLTGTILGSSAFVYLVKMFTERARPPIETAVYAETAYSFPSGHTALAVVFYGILAWFFGKRAKSRKRKTQILFTFFLAIFFIGISRIYLGVHFASDVFGGYLAGGLWLSLGLLFFERLEEDAREKHGWKKFLKYLR